MALTAAACAAEPDDRDTDEVAEVDSAIEFTTVCRDGGAAAPAALTRLVNPAGGFYAPPGSVLPTVVEATGDEWTYVTVSVHGSGLDGRTSKLDIGSTWLGPHESIPFDMPVEWLPIQSEGAPSWIWYETELVTQNGSVTIPSPPFAVEFYPGGQGAMVYGPEGKDWGLPSADAASTLAALSQVASPLADVHGVLFEPQWGGFVDVTWLRQQDPIAGAVGQTAAVVGPHADLLRDGTWEGGEAYADWAPGRTRLCTSWRGAFADAGMGEDYLDAKGLNVVPARRTRAIVTSTATGTPIWSGYTDVEGCTPFLPMAVGSYTLTQIPTLVRDVPEGGRATIDVFYRGGGASRVGLALVTPFDLGLIPWSPPTLELRPTLVDQVTSVAAVMTQVVGVVDDPGLVASTYPIHADERCGEFEACADSNGVFLGWNFDSRTHNANYKYVVGHEFGHMLQDKLMGFVVPDYTDIPATPIPWCRCDHVDVHNQEHCLQSREPLEAALLEGFAHFYASKLMNDPSDGDCAFNYYKEHLLPVTSPETAPFLIRPPFSVSCNAPVHWENDFCLGEDTGVERDWMTFFYRIHNAPPSERVSLNELKAIMQHACNPETEARCDSDLVSWADILGAALNRYGFGDPRAERFALEASISGIDH
ncbi:MAG: hypothetical protein JNL21_20225 [Myxococcales bacterium]|nr:hypothetical protein [Myxococcales bacterium]